VAAPELDEPELDEPELDEPESPDEPLDFSVDDFSEPVDGEDDDDPPFFDAPDSRLSVR
jgi:hypothetical protein